MKVKAFLCQHKNEGIKDCEDRFCINKDTKSIAVADGMSQSFLPAYWADLLCRNFCLQKEWKPTHESVQKLEPLWEKLRDKYLENEEENNNPFAYLIRNQIAEKASAACTFVGVRIIKKHKLQYNILGDSSLVIFRNKKLKKEDIISTHTGSFDNFPEFFDSNHLRGGKGDPKEGTIEYKKDDVILLVSDPFSDYFYEKTGKGEDCSELLQEILDVKEHEGYEKMIEEWRKNGMHNDDSTLVVLQPDDNKDSLEIEHEDDDPTEKFILDNVGKELSSISDKRKHGKYDDEEIKKLFFNKILTKHKGEEHSLIRWLFIILKDSPLLKVKKKGSFVKFKKK